MGEGRSHWSSMVLRKSQTCFFDRHTHPSSMYSNFCHVVLNRVHPKMNNGEVLDLPHYPPTQTDIDSGKATPSGKAVKKCH